MARREFKGQMSRGRQDREPLRGKSASERVAEREGFQRFLEVFSLRFPEIFQSFFRDPLRDSLGSRFSSQGLSVLLPLVVLPLEQFHWMIRICESQLDSETGQIRFPRVLFQTPNFIDIELLMGLFWGAVFHHGGVPENSPLRLMGRFPSLMRRFPEWLNGPFFIWKIPWKTAH